MERILVALDGSERAPAVLAAAARLAELTGAKLVLFRAIGLPPDLPTHLLTGSAAEIERTLRAAAQASLERLATAIRPGLIECISTELAVAWNGIVDTARTVKADLIVIGSHGYSGLDRVLGTTAAKVVDHADRNVLIVKTEL